MGQYFSIQSVNFYSYPVELQKEILETEYRILKKKATATELEQLVASNPDIPEYKILLFLVYDNQGRNAKSYETAQLTVNEHPGYLAGRCYLGIHYVLKDESEKALQLFNGFVELNELFPDRTGFLSTEEDDYLFMGIIYFASVKNIPPAAKRIEVLKTRNPDYPLLNIAETIVDHARMNRNVKLFEEWGPKRRRVEYSDRTLPQITGRPIFENSAIDLFYQMDLSFNAGEINVFLDLPRESFIRDLERVILDARQRYQHIFYEEDDLGFPDNADTRFLIHAVLFLTECKSEESLPVILGLLEEDEPFYFDWFDEYFEECMVPAIYQLGQHQLEALKKFMFEPNLTLYARDVVANAVSMIALHQPGRRSEVISWFDELFHYFIDHRDDDGIIDTDLIGSMVIYCKQIKAIELLEPIRTLFDLDLISVDFCGPFEDVEADLSGVISDEDVEPFLTIFEQYDYFRSDLEEQPEDDGDDEDDFEKSGPYALPELKKGLESSDRSFYDKSQMPVIAEKTPGRNDPCPCGSGKKYKKCCM
jgi:tetratricopeptide (TPR) repeat protein